MVPWLIPITELETGWGFSIGMLIERVEGIAGI
jgi:hypothetical protein